MDISQEIIEQKLTEALKAKDQVATDALRSLKTRIQNERIAKGQDLSVDDLVALVKSEVKRRKEASESFRNGDRAEQADKEDAEAEVLSQFLPPQMSEEEIAAKIDAKIAENNWTAADFGAAMGQLKQELGSSADGAVLAKLLKSKLS